MFLLIWSFMAHITVARACPANLIACLESSDKYLALNKKLAQASPGEESYEQSKWITDRKINQNLYLAKLEISLLGSVSSQNRPMKVYWPMQMIKSMCQITFHFQIIIFGHRIPHLGHIVHMCVKDRFSYFSKAWNLSPFTTMAITSKLKLQIAKIFFWVKARCHS